MSERALIVSALAITVLALVAAANPAAAAPMPGAIAVAGSVEVQLSRRWWLPYYYYGGPSYPPAGTYCSRQYRSYDPVTGTFIGRDGLRHFCA
jgi:hypothetical protein